MAADSLIPTPLGAFTRAVTIEAPPQKVWPWLAQMGSGRAGWYSYDFIDNNGAPSSWSILPEHQCVAVGDVFPALPEANDAFLVSAVDAERELVLTASSSDGELLVTWDFVLEPLASAQTRLIVRARVAPAWPPVPAGSRPIERIYRLLAVTPKPLMLVLGRIGHGIMEMKMLRGIKRRAEHRETELSAAPKAAP
jgi:hypothetical protein